MTGKPAQMAGEGYRVTDKYAQTAGEGYRATGKYAQVAGGVLLEAVMAG